MPGLVIGRHVRRLLAENGAIERELKLAVIAHDFASSGEAGGPGRPSEGPGPPHAEPGATIKPDFDDHSAGNSITADPYECIFEWEDAARCATPGPTAWCLCEWPA